MILPFKEGTRASASHLNQLVDACNRIQQLRGGGPVLVNGNTIDISMNMLREPLGTPPFRTFAVKVEKDAGAAGSDSTECSWTYTVRDLAGNTLGTGVTPETPRLHFTTYWHAAETRTLPNVDTSDYGLAVQYGETVVILQCYGEIVKTTTCEV